jgi:predicted TPR repeat methyltransferase
MDMSDPPSRELTVDEAIALGIELQKQRHFAEAEQLYARVLEVAPLHPDALHYTGLLAHQQGRGDEAEALMAKSLDLAPDQADWHSNYAIVLQSHGRFDDAITEYRRATAIEPRHANAHSNLGVLLRLTGRPKEAEAAYRRAIQLAPDHADAHTNLGILLNSLGRTKEASDCFCKALTFRPRHRDARRLLALAHSMIGEVDDAVRLLEEWLEDEPGNPIAAHMLAANTGHDVPARASDSFVVSTFDDFAASFEAKLESLSYRAPALVAGALADAGLIPEGRLAVLDAGCGTGLCGPLLRPYASRLVGVDLSGGMLGHAQRKQIYSELAQAELTEFLETSRQVFDVIVAADTLVYFGDLRPFFRAAAGALHPAGLLVVTVEHNPARHAGFALELHGRYSHSEEYVRSAIGDAGLFPVIRRAELRMEAGEPVAGLVIRAANAPLSGQGQVS